MSEALKTFRLIDQDGNDTGVCFKIFERDEDNDHPCFIGPDKRACKLSEAYGFLLDGGRNEILIKQLTQPLPESPESDSEEARRRL